MEMFTLDEEAANAWLSRSSTTGEADDHSSTSAAATPAISPAWDPIQPGEEDTIYLLVRSAQEAGVLSGPPGAEIDFEFSGDDDGGYHRFLLDLSTPTRLKLASYARDMRALGTRDVSGHLAAVAILREAEWAGNGLLQQLSDFVAAVTSQPPVTTEAQDAPLAPTDNEPSSRGPATASRVTLTGVSQHFLAGEIECLVITAAKAVCGQLDDLSKRQLHLAERAYDLLAQKRASPVGRSPQQANRPAEVWVLRHDDRHGDDVSLYASYSNGLGALAQTVRSRWDNITGEPGVPATGDALDDKTAVEMYFRHRSGSESYCLYSETVDGISIAPDADAAGVVEGIGPQDTCS
jgi:hypothetical protein